MSDAETIHYAEPYRNNFTKKDEIHRKKTKQKAIRALVKKKKIDNALLQNTTGTIDGDDVDIDLTAPDENDGASDDDDVTFVKYVPPPSKDPLPKLEKSVKE